LDHRDEQRRQDFPLKLTVIRSSCNIDFYDIQNIDSSSRKCYPIFRDSSIINSWRAHSLGAMGASARMSVGIGLSAGIDVCYTTVNGCSNTPKKCNCPN
jgi:hypothetical protein